MSWRVIARHEAIQSFKARSIRLLIGLFVIVSVTGGYVFPVLGSEPYTTAHFGGYMTNWMATLVPLIGLVLGYNAIVSERVSGALLLSLSLPHTREDVVMGKLAGRLLVVAASILVGLVFAGLLVIYPFGELSLLPFLGFIGLTIGLGAIYIGIGIAISMIASTKQRATIGAFGLYFIFVIVWNEVENAVEFAFGAVDLLGDDLPAPVRLIFLAEPGTIYDRLIAAFIDPAQGVESAWYLNEWIALLFLAGWLVLPVGLTVRYFSEVDL